MSSGDNFHNLNIKKKAKKPTLYLNEFGKKTQLSEIPLKLHRRPVLTIYYALMESLYLFTSFINYILSHKRILIILFLTLTSLISVNLIEGVHQKVIEQAFRKVQWWMWWIFLGFLSSCGFGSGLHTFVLYLGPFIAKVTMAAYECGSIEFLEPPYPNEFLCSERSSTSEMSALIIVRKVLLESIFWGFGTAVGELPPYFMARASALSGSFSKIDSCTDEESAWHNKAQDVMRTIVKRIGFVGIMLCASVPNPLFDLAGMTCGHFLVPFSTFFGATVIGKAINKMLIQLVFVVIIFSKDKVTWIQSCVKQIPRYGNSLHSIIDDFLAQQKKKIHSSIVSDIKEGWLQCIFGYVQLVIILGFVISIVHSLADNYAQRLTGWRAAYNESLEPRKPKHQ